MKSITEQDYRQRVARSVSTILADPAGPHTLETLAAAAHFSPFHFQRLYSAVVGESPIGTVRRIRLSNAAHRLANSDASITAIAVDAGYESSQAFARAFRTFAHMTPGEFRHLQMSLGEERISGRASASIEIVKQSGFEVFCIAHDGPVATIPLAFRDLQRMGSHNGDDAKAVGIVFLDHGRPEKMRYFAGVRRSTAIRFPTTVQPRQVGNGLYAAVRLTGPYSLIAPTFRTLIERWLPQSGFCLDNRPALELYRTALDSDKRNAPITELLLPIS